MKKTATWLAACMAAACALAPVIGCSSETEEPAPGIVYNADEWLITGTSVRLYRGKETDVTIPAGVTEIREHAFERCDAASVTIPGSVTVIGYSAFEGCKSLKSVTIPSSVTGIGSRAFYGCTSLTSVTILASVTGIGDYAFYG
ncbi:MAG: leucine-rich repeat domain-containing protein, partial [Treponemataceae bacterium]|nr:leucine-rich repeat domain-containing protein [Treponemataceae bacterium]